MATETQTFNDGISVEDGAYENAATGLGKKGMDKGANTVVSPYVPADLGALATMKVKDGIAAFIIDGFPMASLMNDVKIVGDEDGAAFKSASETGLFKSVKKAGSALRLTGGSVVVTEYEGDKDAESLSSAMEFLTASVMMISAESFLISTSSSSSSSTSWPLLSCRATFAFSSSFSNFFMSASVGAFR